MSISTSSRVKYGRPDTRCVFPPRDSPRSITFRLERLRYRPRAAPRSGSGAIRQARRAEAAPASMDLVVKRGQSRRRPVARAPVAPSAPPRSSPSRPNASASRSSVNGSREVGLIRVLVGEHPLLPDRFLTRHGLGPLHADDVLELLLVRLSPARRIGLEVRRSERLDLFPPSTSTSNSRARRAVFVTVPDADVAGLRDQREDLCADEELLEGFRVPASAPAADEPVPNGVVPVAVRSLAECDIEVLPVPRHLRLLSLLPRRRLLFDRRGPRPTFAPGTRGRPP